MLFIPNQKNEEDRCLCCVMWSCVWVGNTWKQIRRLGRCSKIMIFLNLCNSLWLTKFVVDTDIFSFSFYNNIREVTEVAEWGTKRFFWLHCRFLNSMDSLWGKKTSWRQSKFRGWTGKLRLSERLTLRRRGICETRDTGEKVNWDDMFYPQNQQPLFHQRRRHSNLLHALPVMHEIKYSHVKEWADYNQAWWLRDSSLDTL